MTISRIHCGVLVLLVIAGLLASCTSVLSPYSLEAYKQATELKARSLAMIRKAEQPYTANAADAEKLMLDIDAAYEFARGRKNVGEVARQWHEIRRPDGGSVGGFMRLWRSQGRVSAFAIEEFAGIAALQFDRIIQLEAARRID